MSTADRSVEGGAIDLDLDTDEVTDASGAADAAERAPATGMTAEELVELTEQLIGERDEAAEARDRYLDELQRSVAEFDNFRKRAARDREEAGRAAVSRFVDSLLPTLDACDAAEIQGMDGVGPIAGALRQALEQHGLTAVGAAGEPFDPQWHEAVMFEPADGSDDGQVVAEVLRTGYRWNDRVLRAAMVKVRG